MSDVQYPFIDVAVHDRVSEAFAAGMAVILFTPELRSVCWANGRGAALFGFASVYDLIDQGPDRGELMFRQVEPIARSLSADGDRRTFTIRIAAGFSRIPVQARCEMIRFQGRPLVLLAVPADSQRLSEAERAARLIEGLDDPETHMAVLDGEGHVVAASGQFPALALSIQTTRMLVTMAGNDRHRLIKRPISTASGYLPAAIGQVSRDPSLNLLLVVGAVRGQAATQPEPAAPIVAGIVDEELGTVIDGSAADYEDALTAVASIEDNPEIEEEISLDADDAVEHGTDTEANDIEAEDEANLHAPADAAGDEFDTGTVTTEANETRFSDAEDAGEATVNHDGPLDQDEAKETGFADETAIVSSVTDADESVGGDLSVDHAAEDDIVGEAADADADADEGQHLATTPESDFPDAATAGDDAAEPVPADTTAMPAAPAPRATKTVRFVWKIDAGGRFSEVSREFAEAVGPHAADISGMAFSDLAALFNLDPDGKIAELLSRRDTWSGKTIWWPVEGTSVVVPVDLAALPTYTRSREFDGFRGFGIVRMGDAAEDPHAAGLSLGAVDRDAIAAAAEPEADAPSPNGTSDIDAPAARIEDAISMAGLAANDDEPEAAGHGDPAADGDAVENTASDSDAPAENDLPIFASVEGRKLPASDKVIRLQERRLKLSPGEQANFQEIARRLDTFARAADDTETAEERPVGIAGQPDAETTGDAVAAELFPSSTSADDARMSNDDLVPQDDDRDDKAHENATVDGTPQIGALHRGEDGDDRSDEFQPDEDGAMPDEIAGAINPEVVTEDEALTEAEIPASLGHGDEDTAEVYPQAQGEQAVEGNHETPDDDDKADDEDTASEPVDAASLAAMMPGRDRTGLSAEIIDQMPVALLVHAGDRLIHANGEFLKLTGYASLDELAEIGGLDALLQRRELEDHQTEAGGMFVVRADDAIVPVTARLQSVRFNDAAALMLALMPVASPVIERDDEDEGEIIPLHPLRDADQMVKLQVEVEELRAILETATDGVVIIGSDGEVRSMNRSASALFNFDAEEINGKPFVTLFAHESQRAIVDYLSGLSGHGVASVLNDGREVIGREASGGFLPLFMTIGRLTSSNGYCAVIRDITQWKRTEEELRTAKRAAETSSAHKSEFLAHVSHEIRTPLNAIIGFADMMASERLGPVGHPRYVEYANDIGRSGRHVLDIVNDLLDISKIEAGELDLDFAAVGLNETVSEAVSLVQPQANGQRVIIRTSLSQSVPQVVADLRSIKQIVLNILSNAIRFTPSGGQIVVSTAYEANGSVVLRVRDTGIGMSRAELELAMKPFRQVAGASRKRGDGTGLGLPLTKAMVDANRAGFAITSAPNEGTLVEITFPSQRVLAS